MERDVDRLIGAMKQKDTLLNIVMVSFSVVIDSWHHLWP